MRIAHVINTFPPYWSGTGIAALNLTVALSKIGHEVHVFIPQTNENKGVKYPGIIVHRLKTLVRFGQAPLLPTLLKISGFDVLHLHYPYYLGGELTSAISKLRNIPEVITYHNDVIKPGILGLFVRIHNRIIAPWLINNAQCVCLMSEKFKQESLLHNEFSRSTRIRIIPQGVDVIKFSPEAEKQIVPEVPRDSPFVLFVRTLDQAHYHSGLDHLLRAMVSVATKCHLVVVGDGELKEYYQKLAKEIRIADRVHFVGKVPNDNLPSYYCASSLFVLPSAETENAGIVLLEAMACGKPVIATDIGGSKQIIVNESNGFLVPPKNPEVLSEKINYLINHPGNADEIGKRARESVITTSSWEVIARQVDAIYQCLI